MSAYSPFIFKTFCSAAIGILGWSFDSIFAPFIAIVPLIWTKATSHKQAFLIMFAYYLAASRGIVPGAKIFFEDGNYTRAFAFWIGSSAALSIPWGLLRIRGEESLIIRTLKLTAAAFSSIPPPLGLFGWTNPLLAAGIFFPGYGLTGIGLMIMLWSLFSSPQMSRLISQRSIAAIVLSIIIFAPDLQSLEHPNFVGFNTSLGRTTSGSSSPLLSYERLKLIENRLQESKKNGELNAANLVLPETICGALTSQNSLKEWKNLAFKILGRDWKEQGRSMFLGAELPTEISEKGVKYDNTVISFGKKQIRYSQKVPVPFSMYRPWNKDNGANGYLFEPEILHLEDGTKAGVIICYEQLLTWPWLLMIIGNNWKTPDVVICTANNWWSKKTSLPAIQQRTRELWSRLIGVPTVSAENT